MDVRGHSLCTMSRRYRVSTEAKQLLLAAVIAVVRFGGLKCVYHTLSMPCSLIWRLLLPVAKSWGIFTQCLCDCWQFLLLFSPLIQVGSLRWTDSIWLQDRTCWIQLQILGWAHQMQPIWFTMSTSFIHFMFYCYFGSSQWTSCPWSSPTFAAACCLLLWCGGGSGTTPSLSHFCM